MAKKTIASAQAKVRNTMETLYDSCRRGKIHDVEKHHKAFQKAKADLDELVTEKTKDTKSNGQNS